MSNFAGFDVLLYEQFTILQWEIFKLSHRPIIGNQITAADEYRPLSEHC